MTPRTGVFNVDLRADDNTGCRADWELSFPPALILTALQTAIPFADIGFEAENCDGPVCTQKVWWEGVRWGSGDPNTPITFLTATFVARAPVPEIGHYQIEATKVEYLGRVPDPENTNSCNYLNSYLFMFEGPTIEVGLCGADADGDAVCDTLDNCIGVANPRRGKGYLDWFPWATLTGKQRDDDADGYGNRCDGDFDQAGLLIGGPDVTYLKGSIGKSVEGDDCGPPANQTMPCAIFDLDEQGVLIGGPDVTLLKNQIGTFHDPSKKCATCPLACEAGSAGHCP